MLLSDEPRPMHSQRTPTKKLNRPVPLAKSETITTATTPKMPALIPSSNWTSSR